MGGNAVTGMSASSVIYPHLSPVRALSIMGMGIAVSLLACWFPARMATGVEPAEALRSR
jgi:hypothetical protein